MINTVLGHPTGVSLATVVAAEGYQGSVGIGFDSPHFLKIVATALKGQDRPARHCVLLVVACGVGEKSMPRPCWSAGRPVAGRSTCRTTGGSCSATADAAQAEASPAMMVASSFCWSYIRLKTLNLRAW